MKNTRFLIYIAEWRSVVYPKLQEIKKGKYIVNYVFTYSIFDYGTNSIVIRLSKWY